MSSSSSTQAAAATSAQTATPVPLQQPQAAAPSAQKAASPARLQHPCMALASAQKAATPARLQHPCVALASAQKAATPVQLQQPQAAAPSAQKAATRARVQKPFLAAASAQKAAAPACLQQHASGSSSSVAYNGFGGSVLAASAPAASAPRAYTAAPSGYPNPPQGPSPAAPSTQGAYGPPKCKPSSCGCGAKGKRKGKMDAPLFPFPSLQLAVPPSMYSMPPLGIPMPSMPPQGMPMPSMPSMPPVPEFFGGLPGPEQAGNPFNPFASLPATDAVPSQGDLICQLVNEQVSAEPQPGAGIKRLERENEAKDAKLGAVIVTIISSGHSYDDMFEKVPQEGPQGTAVATYVARGGDLPVLLRAMKSRWLISALEAHGLPQEAAGLVTKALAGCQVEQLCRDISAVDASSVVFNWECCSGCSQKGFSHPDAGTTLELVELLIKRGHMVMCSDFSLKALIHEWSEERLGPNPFVQLGEFGGSMSLRFDPVALKGCPSAQLQKVGEMCDDGVAQVQALCGTIVYTVDHDRLRGNEHYKLEVLSVASKMTASHLDYPNTLPEHQTCVVGGHKGTAGHVLLRYPSGGLLMASAGHWIELVRINVTEERLVQVATMTYGAEYSSTMQSQLSSTRTGEERAVLTQRFASQMIQQSSPSVYSVNAVPMTA